ncbi:Rho GTPase-activating protein 20 [Exaiptasia diaphana]|nr:Rho GTPase-activating protein 20 [Exaiptasia diaphana]
MGISTLKLTFWFQIQHVTDYDRILSNLLDKTPPDHPDREDLEHAATNFRRIVREREEEIVTFENEVRINQVQDKFPHDNLAITEGEALPRYRMNASRRRSAPSAVLKAALVPKPHLALVRGIPLEGGSLKIKSDSSSDAPHSRHFVQEGSAQVTTGVSTQERHLFLLSDLLFIAKAKSAATYKLKHRVRVSELWLSNCVDDVSDSRPVDKSFVIGWPTTNCVFTFSSTEQRDSWYSTLKKYTTIQKAAEDPKSVTLKVYNRDMEATDSFGVSKSFTVNNTDDASSVVKMSLEQFQIQTDDASEYHLWVLSGKENCAYPLLGHEFPFAIKMNHIREGSSSDDDGLGVFDFDQQLPSMDPLSPSTQCQFILTKSRKPSKLSSMDGQQSSKKWTKQIKKSPIINWAMHKKTSGSKNQCPDPGSPPAGKLFELPLDVLCTEEEPVPKPIQDILKHMFRFGPGVNGIFRRSASAKRAKEIKLDLDSGKEVLFEEVSVLITASILKEFLRRLPDCILDSDDYEEFIATNNIGDRNERIKNIKWLLQNLNVYSFEILKRFMCVLYHIAENCNINSMNAYNLAVCVAPSMLWPPKGSNISPSEQSNDVPPFVQFLVENCTEIFGEDVVTVLGDRSEIVLNQDSIGAENGIEIRTFNSQSSTDDGLESPDPLSPRNERSSIHLSDSNLYDPSGRSKNLLSANVPERNSVSSPNTPCGSPNSSPKLRRQGNFDDTKGNRRSSEPSEVNSESIKMKIKGIRKSARSRRQLSSTTTSAELIEHKSTKTTPSGKRIETAVLKRAHSPMTVQATPVDGPTILKPISKFGSASNLVATANKVPAMKHAIRTQSSVNEERVSSPDNTGFRSPSPTMTPDQVFQAVDRRRQPAAPSYHQHMLRKIGSKPAFFQGKSESEDSNPVKHASRETENPSPKVFNRSFSVPKEEAISQENVELSHSEPSSPKTPKSPTIKLEDENWTDQRDDLSTSSGGSTARRLEHSPFGLSLHHKRSDSTKKVQKFQNQGKTKQKSPNEKQILPNGGNASHALFPHSEFFPHEATQAKTQFSSDPSSAVKSSFGSPMEINNNPVKVSGIKRYSPGLTHPSTLSTCASSPGISPSLSRRKNSHTSSSSSVSSSDDRSSVGTDSVVSETKSTSTQITDLKDLLSVQAQSNGLKISAATAVEIAKVKDLRATGETRHNPGYTSPSHDDIAKMMFTEESYV